MEQPSSSPAEPSRSASTADAGSAEVDPPGATATVFAPSPLLTVTVETDSTDTTEVHLHAGGQGFWIARMLVVLGLDVCLCAPLGGEVGRVLKTLIAAEGVDVCAGATTRHNGAYVHDARSGERATIAEMAPTALSRHEVDELYSQTLASAISADVTVLGGPATPDVVPADTYRRLAADLRAVDAAVVADLSGDALTAALQGGVTVLKVSHEDLIEDGRAPDGELPTLIDAMHGLRRDGAQQVVLSRGGESTLALLDEELVETQGPQLERVDHHGAGDSMTAGLASALASGGDLTTALKTGVAAGTMNVTRRGLATGQREIVEQLVAHIVVRPLDHRRG